VWVRRAAIRPVARHAELSSRALERVRARLSEDDEETRQALDEAFAKFEETQPVLAAQVSDALSQPLDETALALGYFLTIAVWLAFDDSFGADLGEVTETAFAGVEEALQLDEQIRLSDPAEAVESNDVIAMEQPHAIAFVHEQIEEALGETAGTVDVDDVHAIYRLVLIEVLALSYAVRPPANVTLPSAEFTA
jgi:hypothetical protein